MKIGGGRHGQCISGFPEPDFLCFPAQCTASGAVVTFAALQIFGVVAFAGLPGGGWLPLVALGLLLLIAIPFARHLDRRWSRLSDTALPSPGLMHSFRRDRARLWRLACIVPTLWLGLFAVMAEAATL
jgi:hypothetical protein